MIEYLLWKIKAYLIHINLNLNIFNFELSYMLLKILTCYFNRVMFYQFGLKKIFKIQNFNELTGM